MQSLERQVWNAYHTSDRGVLDTLMAPTFVNVDPGGVANKAAILPGLSNYHLKTVSVELESVAALDNDVCLVRTKVHATHDWKGNPLPGNLIASSVWQMISGKWRMVFHQETVAT